MDSKILTIVIPTYNMEKYLRHCLDSLIVPPKQMEILEVLVVNDGSTDRSSIIAHEYQNKYSDTFRVIDKENGNYGSCVNRGLEEAKGKYIKILDADDSFDSKGFSIFLEKLSSLDVDLVLSDFLIQDTEGHCLSYKRYNLKSQSILNFYDICLDPSLDNIQMHGVCYNRAMLLKMGYKQTEGISYTDTEWKFKPLAVVDTVCYINVLVYCYLKGRPGQTTLSNRYKKSANQLLKVAYSNMKFYMSLDEKLDTDIRKYLSMELKNIVNMIYYYGIIFHGLNNGELIKFDQFVKSSNWQYYKDLPPIKIKSWNYPYIKEWRKHNYRLPDLFYWVLMFKRQVGSYKLLLKKIFAGLGK